VVAAVNAAERHHIRQARDAVARNPARLIAHVHLETRCERCDQIIDPERRVHPGTWRRFCGDNCRKRWHDTYKRDTCA
jgi:hypothetical protein